MFLLFVMHTEATLYVHAHAQALYDPVPRLRALGVWVSVCRRPLRIITLRIEVPLNTHSHRQIRTCAGIQIMTARTPDSKKGQRDNADLGDDVFN